MRETELYAPVKALLEGQGYVVKAEVAGADVVGLRGDEPPVIVELKTGFSLTLLHQAVERQRITEAVYVAVPRGAHRALKRNIGLCRRLGIGVITVRLSDGLVEIHADPGPYRPRAAPRRRTRLLREFARLSGDPNTGGATRVGLTTAYRQDALRCLRALGPGPLRAAAVAKATGVTVARRLMADNHYGWFIRESRGVYALGPDGREALTAQAAALAMLDDDTGGDPT